MSGLLITFPEPQTEHKGYLGLGGKAVGAEVITGAEISVVAAVAVKRNRV